jgi:hypothetical protein
MKSSTFAIAMLSIGLVSCGQHPDRASASVAMAKSASAKPFAETAAPAASATQDVSGGVADLPLAIVHKTPTCGCCKLWAEHLRHAGFVVEVRDADDLGPIKEKLGIPYGKGSCHTAEIGGYFVEGHVPANDIKRLLAERPDAKGLTVPGMPLGSPGMEMPDGTVEPYAVELVGKDGATTVYARHGAHR